MQEIIYLSPSTQEANVGVLDYGTEEYRMNELTDILEIILVSQGYIVYRNNPDQNVREIVEESNLLNPSIHVAIHSNAANGNVRGPEVFTNLRGTPGDRLANLIYDQILNVYPNTEFGRGVKYTEELYEVIQTNSPSVLIEIAFHDNEQDAIFIINNIENLAQAIANGINEYFNN